MVDERVRESVDVRLIGRGAVWAAQSPAARNEHFNLTNGEVFAWRDLWPSLAEHRGVKCGPDRPVKLAVHLPSRAHVWDRIVQKHTLRKRSLQQILGESHHSADLRFGYGMKEPPPPVFVRTVKIKQAGLRILASEEAVKYWLGVLMERRIISAAG